MQTGHLDLQRMCHILVPHLEHLLIIIVHQHMYQTRHQILLFLEVFLVQLSPTSSMSHHPIQSSNSRQGCLLRANHQERYVSIPSHIWYLINRWCTLTVLDQFLQEIEQSVHLH
jgi:hypothetical protein